MNSTDIFEDCAGRPEGAPPDRQFPLVSVITPCFNMGEFLEETIQSVLSQDYPNIEYIVMDGGSTDRTLHILERYKDRLRYQSRPDRGTADAVNQGLALSKGAFFAWLSADDTYLPGAVSAAVRALTDNPQAGTVYGEAWWVDESGKTITRYPTRPFDRELLGEECFICQPATFMRRGVFEEAGHLDATLRTSFDYELWMRIAKVRPMVKMDRYLATSRMHERNKTLGQRRRVYVETFGVLSKHYRYVPFPWVYAYASHLFDGRDEFFEPLRPSVRGYLLSFFLGLWHDRRRLGRFLREWASAMKLDTLPRP
jgi:glycosyltransferase involved in cell wall biosynthesis